MDSLAYAPYVCLYPSNLLQLTRQPKLYIALAIALPCGFAGGFLKFYQQEINPGKFKDLVTQDAAYKTLSCLVAFLTAFRIKASYKKFWNGCERAYNIVGELFDGTADLFAFSRMAKADPLVVDNFQQTLIRLVSLLNSVIFAELESGVQRQLEGEVPTAYNFELLDVSGLTEGTLEDLLMSENKPEVVFQWINQLIVEAWHKKIFSIDPPILTRAFSDLAAGMQEFHEAQKITEVPFPFPYMMALQLCICVHWGLTPIVSTDWTDFAAVSFAWCFLLSFSLWFFVGLAMELDCPFQHTINSVDMRYLQRLLNMRLLSLGQNFKHPNPKLSSEARLDVSRANFDTDVGDIRESFAQHLRRRSAAAAAAA